MMVPATGRSINSISAESKKRFLPESKKTSLPR